MYINNTSELNKSDYYHYLIEGEGFVFIYKKHRSYKISKDTQGFLIVKYMLLKTKL